MPEQGDVKQGREIGKKLRYSGFVWQICPKCERGRWVRLERGKPRAVLCQPCFMRGQRGANHPNWQGGRRVSHGYIYILKREHPNAIKKGYVLEHRLVLEEKLGRLLGPNEVPHHLNGVRSDNRPENLVVLKKGGGRGHHGWLVMQVQQERIRELEAELSQQRMTIKSNQV